MDKIDKLKKLLELSQNDTITPKEVEQFLTTVLGFIKKSKDSFDALSAENIQTIKDCVAYLEDYNKKHTDTIDAKINVATGQMEGKMSELKSLIEKVKTLKPADGKDGVSPDPEDVVPLVLAKLPKVEPFTVKRDEVVREINTGKKGDTKIELEQIEGVDKLEKGVIDRAVSILDQRTKFLVNKSVKHDATMTGSGTDADPLSVVGGGGGAVDSVNGQTGVVVLDADDIDDTSTTNKFVTAGDLTKLSNLSGTNSGDVTVSDTAEIDLSLAGQALSASIVASSIDESKLDASVNVSLDLADSSVQPGDNITDLNGTAHRVLYINGTGDVTELALGADGTFLKSNGATSAPSFAVPSGSGGGITRTVTTSSGGFTAGATADTDYVYLIAGAHAVALPTAVGNTNRYTFKNNHSAAITITPDGVETIEGSATIQVAPEDSVDLISNNSVWFLI